MVSLIVNKNCLCGYYHWNRTTNYAVGVFELWSYSRHKSFQLLSSWSVFSHHLHRIFASEFILFRGFLDRKKTWFIHILSKNWESSFWFYKNTIRETTPWYDAAKFWLFCHSELSCLLPWIEETITGFYIVDWKANLTSEESFFHHKIDLEILLSKYFFILRWQTSAFVCLFVWSCFNYSVSILESSLKTLIYMTIICICIKVFISLLHYLKYGKYVSYSGYR